MIASVAAHPRTVTRSRTKASRVGCSAEGGHAADRIAAPQALHPAVRVIGTAYVREAPVNEVDDSVTELIHAWTTGDRVAGDRLFSRVYGELRAIARRLHRRSATGSDETLDTTALVHEVYLRLAGASALTVRNRAHFFALVVRASRQVIVNYARDAQTLKRGGTAVRTSLDAVDVDRSSPQGATLAHVDQVVALDGALRALERLHPRPCRVVECRFFGGMSIPDTALALDVSEATVKRDWSVAQAWLHRALREAGVDHVQ